eukprot:9475965-Pyramimonas_sp.AAC.1
MFLDTPHEDRGPRGEGGALIGCLPQKSPRELQDGSKSVPKNGIDSEIDSEIDRCPAVSRGVPWCPVE